MKAAYLLLIFPIFVFSNFEIIPNTPNSSNITSTSLSASAIMNSDGSLGGSIYLWYGTGDSLTSFQSVGVSVYQGVTLNGVTLSGSISGLSPDTQYIYKWAVANSSGTIIYSSNQTSFTTNTDSEVDSNNSGYSGDHEGNIYQWINYGTLDWSIKNADNSTYKDGTEIPQVTDPTAWSNLTIGAWCYNDDDPNKEKLYNWYAIVGIHDNDAGTPNKTFAPAGWSVPSDSNWDDLENYLITNGYNYDNTTTGNKIGKAMASNSGWNGSGDVGDVGNDQSSNNSSGFNASWSSGSINANGGFNSAGNHNSFHWTSSESTEDSSKGGFRDLYFNAPSLNSGYLSKSHGFSVRLIKTVISTTNDNGLIMHFPFDGNTNELINNTPVNTRTTAYANDRNGDLNKAFYFDGTKANFINGNMPELLDDDYTYSMWIKPLETTSKSWFFVFGENGTASHIGFFQDKLRIGTWGSDGLNTGFAGFSEWKHVLVTFDKTSNTHTLYVNGQQEYSGTKASSFISTYFQIGSQIDNLHEAFNGYMDDLMVWNRVLSQTEITQAYNGTLSLSKTLDFLNIYPNPTSSIINIDFEFSRAKVFDLTGRKLLESRLKTIDLSELPNSIYLLRLYDNSNNVLETFKVIKK